MEYELPSEQIPIFNHHFSEGNRLSESLTILKDKARVKIGFWEKRKLKNAIAHYNKCLELIPDHWQTKWLLGKLYQSINENVKAMQLFEDALAIEKSNPDVAREASIAAIDAGHVELALNYSLEAIKRLPTDSGLMCNHAINLMVAGKDIEAVEWIEKAVATDPMDEINHNAHHLIKSVSEGKRKRPKFDELM